MRLPAWLCQDPLEEILRSPRPLKRYEGEGRGRRGKRRTEKVGRDGKEKGGVEREGRVGKGRSGRGREYTERGLRARLGYLSRGRRVPIVMPLLSVCLFCRNTDFPGPSFRLISVAVKFDWFQLLRGLWRLAVTFNTRPHRPTTCDKTVALCLIVWIG